jgi:hypothetical protein
MPCHRDELAMLPSCDRMADCTPALPYADARAGNSPLRHVSCIFYMVPRLPSELGGIYDTRSS